jgi:hypothetical protein
MRAAATLSRMNLDDGVRLDDDLVQALVDCGRRGHAIAQAHHTDPGSNSFTFGTDRYHRATELARPVLEDHGFTVGRRGAGLIARRPGVELQFAVARGHDLSDAGAFDADSSPGRRRAGEANAVQLVLEGMPELPQQPIVHVVWSGTPHEGLTATHLGKLVSAAERLRWAYLHRVDGGLDGVDRQELLDVEGLPGYADQPVPALEVSARVADRDEDRGEEASAG